MQNRVLVCTGMNTPGNSFGELVLFTVGDGQGLWGKVCVGMYHWPGQRYWKILNQHTQVCVCVCVCVCVGTYEMKQGVKTIRVINSSQL